MRANRCVTVYLSITVVDKDVPCAVVFQVGDLQAVGVSYLLRLEGCVDGVHLDYSFGLLSLHGRGRKAVEVGVCVCAVV